MNPKSSVPDVWGEDWETIADKQAASTGLQQKSQPPSQQILTGRAAKAQRRAAQAEFNRQLWAEAEAEQDAYQPYLETRNAGVPLKSEFKPQLKLLSRKPVTTPPRSSSSSSFHARQIASSGGVARLISGIQRVTLATPDDLGYPVDDEGDDDEEEDERNTIPQLTPEERMRKAQAERAEKQRKYEELRQQLFGSATDTAPNYSHNNFNHHINQKENNNARLGNSVPGSVNGYTSGVGGANGGASGQRNRNNRRGGGGGGGGSGGGHRAGSSSSNKERKQLYDPNYSPKPSSGVGGGRGRGGRQQHQSQERDRGTPSQPSPAPCYIMPIRAPRGPDGSGRGGFGFAPRGGRST
ncbi:hypothetical protein KEM54_000796 [Ascosphaera aggregata]|nr:hypothetical protein KEM54_000796 [Ascosphaera aggregata]